MCSLGFILLIHSPDSLFRYKIHLQELHTLLTGNWEWCLLALYVIEKAIKLSPSKKDDLVWDMVLKPIVEKIKGK